MPLIGTMHANASRRAAGRRRLSVILSFAILNAPSFCSPSLQAQSRGQIEFEFREQQTDAPVASRVKILAADGRPQRARGGHYQQGWNLVSGVLNYSGRVGEYTYQAFHGPEFSAASGGFALDRKSQAQEIVRLPRHADLALEGWVGGDLLSRVEADETLAWLPAEGLSMAAVLGQPGSILDPVAMDVLRDDSSHWVDRGGYVDARDGSGLIFHHWQPPVVVPPELPSSRLLVMAKENTAGADALPVHIEIQRLWARDVPIWLSSGRIDSVQLLGDHLTIDGERAADCEPWLDPDPGRFRGPHRAGRLAEFLYWQMLECGLRLPPTAGSGFGKNASPLGYNRVYAYAPYPTAAAWWAAVRAGQTFVTSGPLLRATVNGEVPGKLFAAALGQSIELDIDLKLTVADPVEYLEVVNNGQTLYRARLDEYARQGGKIPPLTIKQSGWLLIRVVTERDHTYRMATTAPFYFEIGGQPRISRAAVMLFTEWLEKGAAHIETQGAANQSAAAPYLAAARKFWAERAQQATAE